MKLQDGKIILETRTDIDLMQNMIELLNEKGNIGKKEEDNGKPIQEGNFRAFKKCTFPDIEVLPSLTATI